jgi:hypothetical protein
MSTVNWPSFLHPCTSQRELKLYGKKRRIDWIESAVFKGKLNQLERGTLIRWDCVRTETEAEEKQRREVASHLDIGEVQTHAQTRCLRALQPVQPEGGKELGIRKGTRKEMMKDGKEKRGKGRGEKVRELKRQRKRKLRGLWKSWARRKSREQ